MCGYFCIEFIDFMLKGKSLLEYTNLLSRSYYEKNFYWIYEKKSYCVICGKNRKFEKPKEKTFVLPNFCSKC